MGTDAQPSRSTCRAAHNQVLRRGHGIRETTARYFPVDNARGADRQDVANRADGKSRGDASDSADDNILVGDHRVRERRGYPVVKKARAVRDGKDVGLRGQRRVKRTYCAHG